MAMLLPTKYSDSHVGTTSDVAGKRRDIVQEALKGRRPETATTAILMKAICDILNPQAQSLSTFSLAYDFTGHTVRKTVPFALLPQLHELTVAARPKIPSDNMDFRVLSIIPPFSNMPALRTLDMVAAISRIRPHTIIARVLASIPGFTDICHPVMRAHNFGSMDHSLQECMFSVHELHPEGFPAPSLYAQMDPWESQHMALDAARSPHTSEGSCDPRLSAGAGGELETWNLRREQALGKHWELFD
ncbi:hypothetical protein FIBSPDRAFT_954387 [Athelia psychrophila]|uniref:Uncharacterized protein n=1 Tax=Athelia psychrophila TaxID=1759441 RepID=A0A166JBK6_9AGAM|nr:hypothetical protein FIBSPDRAFT_954381 [Fibularhizoctonia sp. CBS 109695]KZP20696.1 hypothetical protein FIBSPDRAFT_954387 [Fibularhizoctonia sp. CBS 109695]